MTHLALTTLIVPDYDEAIAFFRDGLGFVVHEDSDLGDGKRWVVVGGPKGGSLLLAKASNDRQQAAIGDQFGGRVGLIAHTDEFEDRAAKLTAAGAVFREKPRHERYGIVAVFDDPWGNRWDLIQPVG